MRDRAQVPALGNVSMDDIKKEKRLELWMEGCRYQDLIRWGDAATVLDVYKRQGSSSIETREDGLKCAELFRQNRDRIDGIIVSVSYTHLYVIFCKSLFGPWTTNFPSGWMSMRSMNTIRSSPVVSVRPW